MKLWTLRATRVQFNYRTKRSKEVFYGYFSSKESAISALKAAMPEIESWEFEEYPDKDMAIFSQEHSYYEDRFIIQSKHKLDVLLTERGKK